MRCVGPKGRASCRSFVLLVLTATSYLAVAMGFPAVAMGFPVVAVGFPTVAWTPAVRDVGADVGLPQERAGGYQILPRDANRDGWPDLFISRSGSAAELFLNRPVGDTTAGFRLAYSFIDTIHHRPDRQGCAWGDVNRDGRADLYCTKGSRGGTVKKWNELWIQQPDGTFVDRAHSYGVEDIWGRGRRAAFLDLNHDRYPDLFVGNTTPRRDGRPSPNRTFINVDGTSFRQVRLGVTREVGGRCVQVVDVNHDGWDDLLVCGIDDVKLYIRRPGGRFVDRGDRFNVPSTRAVSALVRDVNRDHRGDLIVERRNSLTVQLGLRGGRFGPVVLNERLRNGAGVALGNIDGRPGKDVLIVQRCGHGLNLDDILLLNGGNGRTWTQKPIPTGVPGCGRDGATIDFDRDGMADFAVINGGGWLNPGPDQLLTMGRWLGP
jgi:hypothetical protein